MPVHSAVCEAEVGRSLAAHSSGAQKDHLLTVNSAGDAASVSAFLAPSMWEALGLILSIALQNSKTKRQLRLDKH